jgi:hypothetical protein
MAIDSDRNDERGFYEGSPRTPKARATLAAAKSLLLTKPRITCAELTPVMKKDGWGDGRCHSALNGLVKNGFLRRFENPPTYGLP